MCQSFSQLCVHRVTLCFDLLALMLVIMQLGLLSVDFLAVQLLLLPNLFDLLKCLLQRVSMVFALLQ